MYISAFIFVRTKCNYNGASHLFFITYIFVILLLLLLLLRDNVKVIWYKDYNNQEKLHRGTFYRNKKS